MNPNREYTPEDRQAMQKISDLLEEAHGVAAENTLPLVGYCDVFDDDDDRCTRQVVHATAHFESGVIARMLDHENVKEALLLVRGIKIEKTSGGIGEVLQMMAAASGADDDSGPGSDIPPHLRRMFGGEGN
jgi:hypothetical protein